MINSVDGSLVVVDLNTDHPSVFWKGQRIDNLSNVAVRDGNIVVLQVRQTPLDVIYAEMEASGIKIKKVGVV